MFRGVDCHKRPSIRQVSSCRQVWKTFAIACMCRNWCAYWWLVLISTLYRQIMNVTWVEHAEFPPSELNRQFRGSITQSLYFPLWIAKVWVSANLRTAHILWSAADNQHRAAEKLLRSHILRLRSAMFSFLNLPFCPTLQFHRCDPSKYKYDQEAFLAINYTWHYIYIYIYICMGVAQIGGGWAMLWGIIVWFGMWFHVQE